MRYFLLVAMLMSISALTFSQPDFPKRGHVFDNDLVPKVFITLPEDSLQWIYEHVDDDREFKADFAFQSGDDIEPLTDVGFRLRGNTSREAAKKSFKISFNSFVPGQKYRDLEKMNLNGEHNDPSVIRSYIFWSFCRDMRLQGSRANHVELYINNRYYGLYMNVEHVDEEFIEKRFIDNSGNLYKCLWGADFSYLGENPQSYIDHSYTLETNEETGDYSRLINLIKVLNETSDDQLPSKIEPLFNVNGFLRYLAIETFTSHWDGYSFNENNYYLYENKYTGKIEFMPYDGDNTFGIDWFNIDWANRDIYNWTSEWGNRPLTKKILANQVYKDRYSYFLSQLAGNYALPDSLFPKIDRIKAMIDASAENDTYRPLDYGWSFDDYTRSYTEALGDHVKIGLKPYIEARVNSIQSQLDLNAISPIVENIYHNFPTLSQEVVFTIDLTDDQPNPSAKLFYSFNGSAEQQSAFNLNASDVWKTKLAALNQKGTLKYYVVATDASGNTTRDPLSGYYELNLTGSDIKLAINEFMADNTVSVLDNYGQYEDWIEITNTGSSPVNLKGKYLTDNFSIKTKWAFPDTVIQPGGFYVVWADDDAKQGFNHANFKISRKGDQIGIFEGIENQYAAIDTISYSEQTSNVSSGRFNGAWSEQAQITPGGANEDANFAYITFAYNMNQQVAIGRFDTLAEHIDIAANFNNWYGSEHLADGDGDGILRGTLFGFTKGQQIEYKARMNGEWNRSEFLPQGSENSRTYKVVAGKNYLSHWFNDQGLDVDDNLQSSQFAVYPNPAANGIFAVSIPNQAGTIRVYSITGQLIEARLIMNTLEQFNVSGSKGIYLVAYTNDKQETRVMKLIVN